MKIVFTHAYYLQLDEREKAIMKPYPPLGILYLSAWLQKFGYDNEVFDSTFSTQDEQINFLVDFVPEVIAIYTNLMSKLQVIQLIDRIRKSPKIAGSLIVIGGPDVTHNIQNYLEIGGDVLVIGEGEQTMLELVDACERGLRPHFGHISGIAFKDEFGDIIKTEARQKINDIDELPMPNRGKIDLHQYLETWKVHHGKSTVSVSTQRGCPYTCKWCSTAVYGQSYRRRSPEAVVQELLEIKQTYHPDQIWFVDDVFTISYKWLEAFKNAIIAKDAVVPFECITRADRLNADVIRTLKAAGCFRVWIGAESGSQKVLDAMDRRVKASWVQDMIIESKKQGLEAGTFIMLGYPGETEEDIFETLEHLKSSNPSLFTITVAYPIKGTALYEETESIQINSMPWQTSTDRQIDFQRTYPKSYYNFAVKWINNSMKKYQLMQRKSYLSKDLVMLNLKIAALRMGMKWYKLKQKKKNILHE